ncbi:pickpocket protein 28-like isoform X1 [Bradysia coprophila]|uniref:pickpocket protein 28-like isoform X1 n=1 Tax=Bradysia coprophila TaxID=38358 RepID=UPI00187D7F12|nr:pickpocket protein 28-like isoform X1 [Bradysia coprophila]
MVFAAFDHDQFVLDDEQAATQSPQSHLLIDDYCNNSTIHGVKYLASRKNTRNERIFWLLALIISSVLFIFLFSKVWTRYGDGPIAIEISPYQKPIWDIPFPAITICTETKSKASEFKFSEVYGRLSNGKQPFTNVTPEELNSIRAMAQVCDSHLTTGYEFNQNTTSEDIFQNLEDVAPTMSDVLFFCKKRNNPTNCDSYFSEVWTEDGKCFTYNIVNSTTLYTTAVTSDLPPIAHNNSDDHWDIETGYNEKATNDILSYPYRAHSGGSRGAFIVLLNLNSSDFDHLCRGPIVGFKVTMHRPDEVPFVSKEWFRVPMDQETYVSITPKVTLTADSVKSYSVKSRQCYFGYERQLKYFKTYTQRNCEMECVSDFIIKKCGCTRFSMPRTNSIPICGASMIQCYHKAEDELLRNNIRDSLIRSESENSNCNCLPVCTSIKYETEISHSDFDFKSLFVSYGTSTDEFKDIKMARITFAFKDSYFNPMIRKELYSFTEAIALSGGLMALFFGASLLSLLEIIFYFTLRLWSVLKK